MEIQQSTDYSQFETITGNRNINQSKVDNIVTDIKKGLDLLPYCPVIVYEANGKLNIVDGQHRFYVSMTMERPVYYVVAKEITLHQIAIVNSKQDKWKAMDFINCYIKVGIEDYITLLYVIRKYKVSISIAVELLTSYKVNQGGHKNTLDFQSGKFKVNHYDETVELLELNHKLFDRYVFYRDRKLIEAVFKLKNKGLCDFDILLEKIGKNPVMMDKQDSVKNYIYNIERVYNHNNQHRKAIF